jgi:hypothetical protein
MASFRQTRTSYLDVLLISNLRSYLSK